MTSQTFLWTSVPVVEVTLEGLRTDHDKHGCLWEGGFGGRNYSEGKNMSPSVILCLTVSMFYCCNSVYNYKNYEICLYEKAFKNWPLRIFFSKNNKYINGTVLWNLKNIEIFLKTVFIRKICTLCMLLNLIAVLLVKLFFSFILWFNYLNFRSFFIVRNVYIRGTF